jgi:hypothetical protein
LPENDLRTGGGGYRLAALEFKVHEGASRNKSENGKETVPRHIPSPQPTSKPHRRQGASRIENKVNICYPSNGIVLLPKVS